MKKVRLNLGRGVKQWSFTVYDSPESALYLRTEPLTEEETADYRRVVSMKPGESIEAEWLGSEWIYDNDMRLTGGIESGATCGYAKYDKVRLGKIAPVKGLSKETIYLELYSGWVSSEDIPWSKDATRKDIKITPIKGRVVSKLDFSKLFSDHLPEDDEDPQELPKEVPAILN